jgi:nucleotide-binding universal stress UspA family protein
MGDVQMLNLKTILAPVDFSERTEVEAQNAADIARHFGSRLILLHVIPQFAELHPVDPAAVEAYSQEFSPDVEKGVGQALQALASRVASDLETECAVLTGGPEEHVDDFALSRQIDLVVLPTDSTGRIRRQMFGSVTSRLLDHLNCPILTGIHPPVDELGTKTLYKKIACKVEPGEPASERIRWARDFAAAYGGSLLVVAVLPFLDSLGAPPPIPEPARDEAMLAAKQKLQQLCDEERADAEIAVLGGPIDDVLPPFIQANQIDLLVSGRRRNQERIGALGFHTDIIDTTQSVPCPMVLV